MLPPPWASIGGISCFIESQTPLRFTSTTASK